MRLRAVLDRCRTSASLSTGIALLGILVAAGVAAAADSRRLDAKAFTPVTLKDLLKTRDLQFDNLSFRFQKQELKSKVIPTEFGEELPPEGQGVTAKVITDYRVTVRGPETTIDVTESVEGGIDLGFIPQRTRTSNAGGKEMVRQVIPGSGSGPGEVRISHTGDQPADGLLEQDRMFAEFCLGFGYGKRIIDITSIEQAGDDIAVQATIKLYEGQEDVSQARLIIDNDFIVRQARLQTRDEADGLVSEITTTGVLPESRSGQLVAASSHHKRTIFWTDRSGARRNSPQVDAPYQTNGIHYDLTPEEYSTLSTIDLKTADRVVDLTPRPEIGIANTKPSPPPKRSHVMLYLVIANAVILAVLGLVMLGRRLSSK